MFTKEQVDAAMSVVLQQRDFATQQAVNAQLALAASEAALTSTKAQLNKYIDEAAAGP